jgi:putative drug exporter of the RND superfamily
VTITRLADWVLAHRRITVLAWVLLAGAGGLFAAATTARLTVDFTVSGQPSYRTDGTIEALYRNGGSQPPTILVVTAPSGASVVRSSAKADAIFAAAGSAYPDLRVADSMNTGSLAFVTADRRSAFALISTPPSGDPAPVNLSPGILAAAARMTPPGWTATVTGLTQLENAGYGNQGGVLSDTLIGGAAALLVLLLTYRTGLSVIPLVMAGFTIPVMFLATLLLTTVMHVSFVVQYLIALIGLGVAIDYSLLIVTRWRAARYSGQSNLDAVRTAVSTGGRACVSSGIAVAISLLALTVLPAPFLRSIGVTCFLIPLISVLGAVTLLPVLLSVAGPVLDRPVRFRRSESGAMWTRWGRFVYRYKFPAALAGIAIIAALLLPVFSIRVGEPSTSSLSGSGEAHAALDTLTSGGIPTGVVNPIELLTRSSAADAIADRLRKLDGVFEVAAPDTPQYRKAGLAIVDVLPRGESSSPAGQATVARVEAAADKMPGVLGVGGVGAEQAAFNSAIYGKFPLFIGIIALLTFIILVRTFRSVLLAAKAIILNSASVGCAYGIMVLVWQRGWGSETVWHIPATGAITEWVPVAVFGFLFGLSMDYEVFILTRMREEFARTDSTELAVIRGIGATGRLVTSSALILFCAIAALSKVPLTEVKILATGLGAGILVDAFVIRALLVPALVGAFGSWNWWLPFWLKRMLRVVDS